jgi:hypothetical protein
VSSGPRWRPRGSTRRAGRPSVGLWARFLKMMRTHRRKANRLKPAASASTMRRSLRWSIQTRSRRRVPWGARRQRVPGRSCPALWAPGEGRPARTSHGTQGRTRVPSLIPGANPRRKPEAPGAPGDAAGALSVAAIACASGGVGLSRGPCLWSHLRQPRRGRHAARPGWEMADLPALAHRAEPLCPHCGLAGPRCPRQITGPCPPACLSAAVACSHCQAGTAGHLRQRRWILR